MSRKIVFSILFGDIFFIICYNTRLSVAENSVFCVFKLIYKINKESDARSVLELYSPGCNIPKSQSLSWNFLQSFVACFLLSLISCTDSPGDDNKKDLLKMLSVWLS